MEELVKRGNGAFEWARNKRHAKTNGRHINQHLALSCYKHQCFKFKYIQTFDMQQETHPP
jgi:hypothetical protein